MNVAAGSGLPSYELCMDKVCPQMQGGLSNQLTAEEVHASEISAGTVVVRAEETKPPRYGHIASQRRI